MEPMIMTVMHPLIDIIISSINFHLQWFEYISLQFLYASFYTNISVNGFLNKEKYVALLTINFYVSMLTVV